MVPGVGLQRAKEEPDVAGERRRGPPMEPIQQEKNRAELGKRSELSVQQSDNGANSGQRRREPARPLGPFPYSSLNEDMDKYAKIAVLLL